MNFFRLLLSKNIEVFSTDQLKVIEEAAKNARSDKMKLDRAVRQATTKVSNNKRNQKVHVGDEMGMYLHIQDFFFFLSFVFLIVFLRFFCRGF